VAYADEGLLNLVNLVVNCDKLIKSYAKKVNNTIAYAVNFGHSDAVFQAMKYALTNALTNTTWAELDTLRIAAEKGMVALEEQHAAIKAGCDQDPPVGKPDDQTSPVGQKQGAQQGQQDGSGSSGDAGSSVGVLTKQLGKGKGGGKGGKP
jgi:hypothetical protein